MDYCYEIYFNFKVIRLSWPPQETDRDMPPPPPPPPPPRSHVAWYRNSPNKESIFELDCHTVSLAAGWNDLTFQLNWKTALCMLADMGRETV